MASCEYLVFMHSEPRGIPYADHFLLDEGRDSPEVIAQRIEDMRNLKTVKVSMSFSGTDHEAEVLGFEYENGRHAGLRIKYDGKEYLLHYNTMCVPL